MEKPAATNQTIKRQTMEELDLLLWEEEECTGLDELDENPSFRTMDVLDGHKEP